MVVLAVVIVVVEVVIEDEEEEITAVAVVTVRVCLTKVFPVLQISDGYTQETDQTLPKLTLTLSSRKNIPDIYTYTQVHSGYIAVYVAMASSL